MTPELATILDEFRTAQDRLHRLAARVPAGRWNQRAHADRWSVAECVEHLNLTGRAYLPLLEGGLAEARRFNGEPPRRYRRDPLGWLLWKMMGPPVRHRVRTTPAFIPSADLPPEEIIGEFDRLQADQMHLAEAADGLPLQKVRIPSPFDPRVKYNLFSCLSILPRHQHRHLWQAEQVLPELDSSTK